MRSTMSLSNVEYAVLKKKSGLYNWGFSYRKGDYDFDLDEVDDLLDEVMTTDDFEQ